MVQGFTHEQPATCKEVVIHVPVTWFWGERKPKSSRPILVEIPLPLGRAGLLLVAGLLVGCAMHPADSGPQCCLLTALLCPHTASLLDLRY